MKILKIFLSILVYLFSLILIGIFFFMCTDLFEIIQGIYVVNIIKKQALYLAFRFCFIFLPPFFISLLYFNYRSRTLANLQVYLSQLVNTLVTLQIILGVLLFTSFDVSIQIDSYFKWTSGVAGGIISIASMIWSLIIDSQGYESNSIIMKLVKKVVKFIGKKTDLSSNS